MERLLSIKERQTMSDDVKKCLPCPFCGGEKTRHILNRLLCESCGASGPNAAWTSRIWNTRAEETKLRAEVERLKRGDWIRSVAEKIYEESLYNSDAWSEKLVADEIRNALTSEEQNRGRG